MNTRSVLATLWFTSQRNVAVAPCPLTAVISVKTGAPSGKIDAATIGAALGGKDNLLEVDNCFTRLRLKVKDNTKIDQATLKNQTGASGVMIKGQIVQVSSGLTITVVRRAVDEEVSN